MTTEPRPKVRRRIAQPVAAAAPRDSYLLAYGPRAFEATVHRVGCACVPRPSTDHAALAEHTWPRIQHEPLVRKLTGLGWSVHRAPCASAL